jgi:hypothetical protein
MRTKYANLILFLGVACFLTGATLLFLGRMEAPSIHSFPALGLILIGAGAAARQSPTKDR